MGRLKIGTTGLTDYESETHHFLLDFFPLLGWAKLQ